MNGNIHMKQMTNILKKNGKDLTIIHELIVPRYDEDIMVKVYQEQSNDKDDVLINENQFWMLCKDDLIPFKSMKHLIIISQHKEIPISIILEIARVCGLSLDGLYKISYYKLQYHLYNELNKIAPEKLKEVVIELLFKQNDVIRTNTDAMLFLDSVTSSPHFNYDHVNLLIELCQTEKKRISIVNSYKAFIYEVCSSIIQSKLMNSEHISDSKEAQRYFNKIFEDYLLTIKKVDLQHIGFICTLLKSSLLTKEQYKQIIDKVKTMDEPVDFVLLEKALIHSYVSKEIVDWMIGDPRICYIDILFNISDLTENQLMKLYEKKLIQDKISSPDKDEFLARYYGLHVKHISDDYIHHPNPTIRKFVSLSQYLTEGQIDSLLIDNDVEVLSCLAASHILSEEQLDKLIKQSHQVFNEKEIEHVSYHIVNAPFLSDEQLWKMVLSKSYIIQVQATFSNNLNTEQLDILLKSKFEYVRQRAKSSLIYALHYHTLDDLKANIKYNKMKGLLFTQLIETLVPIG